MKLYDRLTKRFFRYLITVQENRVCYLEAQLKEAREKLKASQEVYVTAYVNRYWRGKDFRTYIKQAEETLDRSRGTFPPDNNTYHRRSGLSDD